MAQPARLQSVHINIDTVTGWQNDDLQRLKNLKRLGQKSQLFRDHFREQQDNADNAGPDLQQVWLKKMKKIMNQIDNSRAAEKLWVVPFANRPFRFLDLGCCPGGFSTYILKKNKESTSVGVSLDPAQGGHPYLLEEALRPRQTVIFADMTTFLLGCSETQLEVSDPSFQLHHDTYFTAHSGPPLIPIPKVLLARDFDLVLLDAHHLRNQTSNSNSDLLAISQVLLALLSIKFGGTIVMKLASPDTQYTATMLFMLDMLSSSIHVHKPYAMHRVQNTFYVIARGVGGKPDRRLYMQDEVIPGLRRVWERLRQRADVERQTPLSGRNHPGGQGGLVMGDLDFIVNKQQLGGYGERLHELCASVWKLQVEALETRLSEMGISTDSA
ncbi:hypothetical protein F5878DRAFT_609047 [Lentinula raphanica]|uniref:Ribosomal RNA methyltransferase FtsJ domain-containing protein n=1 Tax=Lentinula raphanica TaxID=153919 RepID=A0AA38UI01_9AGAR|nr:hypothetical protein F5878DRAFT_609047 [Lentinula raphanica]